MFDFSKGVSSFEQIDPMIFAQIQQISQITSSAPAQIAVQQQGQQQVVQQNQVEQQQGM